MTRSEGPSGFDGSDKSRWPIDSRNPLDHGKHQISNNVRTENLRKGNGDVGSVSSISGATNVLDTIVTEKGKYRLNSYRELTNTSTKIP